MILVFRYWWPDSGAKAASHYSGQWQDENWTLWVIRYFFRKEWSIEYWLNLSIYLYMCDYLLEIKFFLVIMDFVLISISDDTNIYYILLATLPVMLLLILVVSGVFCFRVMSRRCVKHCNDFYPFLICHPLLTILSVSLPFNILSECVFAGGKNRIQSMPCQDSGCVQ